MSLCQRALVLLTLPLVGTQRVRAWRVLNALIFHGIILTTLSSCDRSSNFAPCPNHQVRDASNLCATPPPKDSNPEPRDPNDLEPTPVGPTRCPSAPAQIRLSEVLVDPEGVDGAKEWVELEVLREGMLDGMYLSVRPDHVGAPSLRVPLMGRVRTGAYLAVDDLDAASIPLGCLSANGCFRNGGGVLELRACDDQLLDVLDWGDASAASRAIRSGYSLSLCEATGEWLVASTSLGAPNGRWRDPLACPVSCSRPQWLVINEILYDLVGADGEGEFIELRTEPLAPMQGIRVHGVNGNDGKPLFAPLVLAGHADERGYYLIAGADYPDRQAALPTQLQNGPEALLVEDCDGLRLDAITWGGDSPLLSEYNDPSPVLAPGLSLGRYPESSESASGMGEFRGMTPTPGAPNRAD